MNPVSELSGREFANTFRAVVDVAPVSCDSCSGVFSEGTREFGKNDAAGIGIKCVGDFGAESQNC